MYTFLSKSSNDTLEFAKNFAKDLTKGDVVVLIGDLGSGKTKFTEGILSYFGIGNEISSPTFTIVNEYNANNIDIFHFDVYRLNNSFDFYNIGGEEGTIAIIGPKRMEYDRVVSLLEFIKENIEK